MVRICPSALARIACACGVLASGTATAGSIDLFGIPAEYKFTLGYAQAVRMEDPEPALIDGPIDIMQVQLNTDPLSCPTLPTPCLGSFGHTGLPTTILFDDGNRDFDKGARLNDRLSAYTEWQFKLDNFGIGDVGAVASGAAHYDKVFLRRNDHDNPETVNRHLPLDGEDRPTGDPREWTDEAKSTNGRRARLLEAYAYGQWYVSDTIGLSLRAGKHLAAWGESLFFPGIVSAQGPFDATKANVPGVEIKEILLPVNQVSMQMSVTEDITVLAYNQFEFDETEIYPQGDFFSPADLVGPGATFGYGSINPLHDEQCHKPSVNGAAPTAPGSGPLCVAAQAFDHQPYNIMTLRTADQRPDSDAEKKQYGLGLKYALTSNVNLGAYHIRYNNHNPGVSLNMGYAYVGDVAGSCANRGDPGCQEVTTQQFNVRVPVSYTVTYADNIEMNALSFSTVFWVFNIAGEVIQRRNVDTSIEATISGVVAPVGTRGDTTTAQMSFLYVNNPDFLMFDEIVVVGEVGYTQVDDVDARRNEDGICYTGAEANNDCDPGKPADQYLNSGDQLFYDEHASAIQMLILPKGRNVFSGWDISTPINFAWLVDGTPSTPGVFGALYGEGDMRASLGVTGQFLQNFELSLSYNAFFGDPDKHIGNSTLKANPYVDHDYLALSAKYNL
jgi:hypothetical protein